VKVTVNTEWQTHLYLLPTPNDQKQGRHVHLFRLQNTLWTTKCVSSIFTVTQILSYMMWKKVTFRWLRMLQLVQDITISARLGYTHQTCIVVSFNFTLHYLT